jgi:hypothetical protein
VYSRPTQQSPPSNSAAKGKAALSNAGNGSDTGLVAAGSGGVGEAEGYSNIYYTLLDTDLANAYVALAGCSVVDLALPWSSILRCVPGLGS